MKDGTILNMTQGFKHIHESIKTRARKGQLTIKEGMKKENEMLRSLEFWRRQIFKAKNDFEGAAIARALHLLYEMVRKKADEQDPIGTKMVSCRAGCNACCRIRVTVTKPEAQLLARRVAEGVTVDRALLERQAKAYEDLESWRELSMEDRMCVFMGEDAMCRVYEDRPLMCRNYRVTSDPKNCETSKISPVTIKLEPNAEIFITAAFTDLGTAGLPTLLADELASAEAAKAAAEANHSSPSSGAQEEPPRESGAPSSTPDPVAP